MVFDYFTPVRGLVGGALIGSAAATLLLFNGDVLGASGIMSSFVVAPKATLLNPKNQWKLFFIVTFFLASRIYILIHPSALDDLRTGVDAAIPIVSPLGFLIGGFLVGFGTRLGNGCTTGHGICGMARMSIRSFVGVGSFMFSGLLFASTFPVTNVHLRDTPDSIGKYEPTIVTNAVVSSIIGIIAVFALIGLVRHKTPSSDDASKTNRAMNLAASVMASILFVVGLILSEMTVYSKIFGFLDVGLIPSGAWDPTLVMVMAGGFFVSLVAYQWVNGFNIIKNSHALQCPLSEKSAEGTFDLPTNKMIDCKLILGELIFGLGWGMAGLCPGPAMVLGAAGYPNVLLRWWPMFFLGSFLAEKAKPLFPQRTPRKQEVAAVEEDIECNKIEDTGKTAPSEDEFEDSAVVSYQTARPNDVLGEESVRHFQL